MLFNLAYEFQESVSQLKIKIIIEGNACIVKPKYVKCM